MTTCPQRSLGGIRGHRCFHQRWIGQYAHTAVGGGRRRQKPSIRSRQKRPEAIRSNQKPSEATGSNRKPPEATRSHKKPPAAMKSHQEATRSHQKPSEAIRSHRGPSGAIASHWKPPETIGSHWKPPEAIGSHREHLEIGLGGARPATLDDGRAVAVRRVAEDDARDARRVERRHQCGRRRVGHGVGREVPACERSARRRECGLRGL